VAVRARARLEIRRMRQDDLDEVMLIERAAFRHPWSPELFRRELEHDWSTILVAVEPLTSASGKGSERIIAFLIFWLVHDEVHILNVAVLPEYRRRGIGLRLVAEGERRLREQGAIRIGAIVLRHHPDAVGFWQAAGYTFQEDAGRLVKTA